MNFRKISKLAVALVSFASPLVAMSATSNATTTKTYTTVNHLSWGNPTVPTGSQLPSQGDAWSIAFSKDAVYSFMHAGVSNDGSSAIDCYSRATGNECPNFPFSLDDPTYGVMQAQTYMYYDASSSHLFALIKSSLNSVSSFGLVSIDVSTSTPSISNFTVFGTGNSGNVFGSPLTDGKLYLYSGESSSSASASEAGKIYCYNVVSQSACAHPVIDMSSLTPGSAPAEGSWGLNASWVGNHFFYGDSNGAINCVDLTTAAPCNFGGVFSATGNSLSNSDYTTEVIPYISSNNEISGFCYNGTTGVVCENWAGTSLTVSSDLQSFLTNTNLTTDGGSFRPNGTVWTPANIIGSRLYAVDEAAATLVYCYDFATAATCPNYPYTPNNPNEVYNVQSDPFYPGCIWAISDGYNDPAAIRLQTFNGSTGVADCSNLTTQTPMATFTNSCSVTKAGILKITSPGTVHGTVTVKNAAGANLHAPLVISKNQVDLKSANVTASATILFNITSPANTRAITADMTWTGPTCAAMTPHVIATTSLRCYFAYDVRTLSNSEKAKVMAFALGLKNSNFTHVLLTGYTDSKGSVAYNNQLSKDRASNVATLLRADLASLHVTTITVTTAGHGIRTTDATHALNRTVIATTSGNPV